jgi:hypothetical protein
MFSGYWLLCGIDELRSVRYFSARETLILCVRVIDRHMELPECILLQAV